MKKIFFFCAFCLFCQSFFALAQVKTTFKIHVLEGVKTGSGDLFLAGDFNGWKPAEAAWKLVLVGKGNYMLKTNISRGIHSFKITRGSWQSVECDAFGKAIANHQVTMENDTTINMNVQGWQDNFAPPEKKHTATSQVMVLNENFDIPQLGRQRRVWLYLPKGYAAGKQKYPVLYMHDGQNLFDEYTAGYGEWGIDELMEQVPEKDQCIIVAVDHGGDNRITEYDPYDSKYGKGRGEDHTDFLVKTLKPYIDAHYRTKPDANHTAIAGSSMGGLISMYAALKYPGVFGRAGIFSPAFWIAPEIYAYAQQQSVGKGAGFYFVCGDAESDGMVPDMQKMTEIIKAKDVSEANIPVVIVKGAQHNEKQWNGDFPGFYNWLIAAFKQPAPKP